jgi:hypothetical protein
VAEGAQGGNCHRCLAVARSENHGAFCVLCLRPDRAQGIEGGHTLIHIGRFFQEQQSCHGGLCRRPNPSQGAHRSTADVGIFILERLHQGGHGSLAFPLPVTQDLTSLETLAGILGVQLRDPILLAFAQLFAVIASRMGGPCQDQGEGNEDAHKCLPPVGPESERGRAMDRCEPTLELSL